MQAASHFEKGLNTLKYRDLEKNFKAKLNGTLSSMLRGTTYDLASEVYADFLDRKIFSTDIGIYYTEKPSKEYDEDGKEILDLKLEYKLDEEFLEDIKEVIIERFNKKSKVVTEKKEKKEKDFDDYMKSNKATDKQKRYASKLYKQLYGEKKVFDDKEYTMKEMSDTIQDLLHKIAAESKVIEVDFVNKTMK